MFSSFLSLVSLEFKIALRYLFIRSKEEGFISLISLFSFLGIFLGVSTLIIVMSVMNGFREKLISGILGVSGHIKISSAPRFAGDQKLNQIYHYEKLLKLIEDFQNSKKSKEIEEKFNVKIESVTPETSGQALINFENQIKGVYILGLKSLQDKKKIFDSIIISEEKNFDFDLKPENKEKILIGSKLSETFLAKIGDKISLISPSSDSLLIGEIPNSKEFELAGIFETKIFDIDSNLIYMDLDFAKYFFNLDEWSVSQIEINSSNPFKSLILKNELKKFIIQNLSNNKDIVEQANKFSDKNDFFIEDFENFDEESNQENNLIFSDWSEINGSYLNALDIEKKVMFLILSFIIFVAIFNVISSLIMMVNEKTKSIAILKTMGMTSNSIMRIFFYCGMMISFSGVFFGGIFGIFFSINLNNIKNFLESGFGLEIFNPIIYLFKDIPAIINWNDIFWIIFSTILISIFAIIPPSLKASKKDPASILKYF